MLKSPPGNKRKKNKKTAQPSCASKCVSQEFLQKVVEALPTRAAMLDDQGQVVAVNQSWINFCKENSILTDNFGVGIYYPQLCRNAQCFCCENGPKAADGIESVLYRHKDHFYLEYLSNTSRDAAWFRLMVSRFVYSGECWVIINHEKIAESVQPGPMPGHTQENLEEGLEQRTSVLKATNWELRQEIACRVAVEKAVSEERNRFRTLVETIPHGIMEFNIDGIITFANGEYYRIHECPEGTLIGKCLWDIVKDDFPNAQNCIQKSLHEQPSPTTCFYNFRTPSGKCIEIKIDWNYKRDTNGGITGFIIITTDVTQQRRAEEEAQQHLNQLAHVSRVFTMSQMVSGLAHELNQPLTAIANYAQACRYRIRKSAVEDRDVLFESIEQISVQADRAGQIIRRLRDFVRRADSSRSIENINELVGEVLRLLEIDTRAHGVCLETKLASDLPPVAVDRIQIEQVITNLVKNAMEATWELAPEMRRVFLRTEINTDGMLEVSVTDTGKGIETEELDHVFEPFYTTKQSGMGLGLSISRSIVESHGGCLTAVRNSDKGMSFSFALPIAAEGGKA